MRLYKLSKNEAQENNVAVSEIFFYYITLYSTLVRRSIRATLREGKKRDRGKKKFMPSKN